MATAAFAVSAAQAHGDAGRVCSKRIEPDGVTHLRVSGSSCATAAGLARGWSRRRACDPDVPFIDRRCAVAGWHCLATRVAIVTTRRVSCSRRAARVRFRHREQ